MFAVGLALGGAQVYHVLALAVDAARDAALRVEQVGGVVVVHIGAEGGKGAQGLGEFVHGVKVLVHLGIVYKGIVGLATHDEGVEVVALLGKVHVGPLLKVGAHVGLELALQDVAHGRHGLDALLAHRQVELAALHEEVDVGVPVLLLV